MSMAAGGAWDEPTDVVGNSECTMDFILCDLPEFWQQIQIARIATRFKN